VILLATASARRTGRRRTVGDNGRPADGAAAVGAGQNVGRQQGLRRCRTTPGFRPRTAPAEQRFRVKAGPAEDVALLPRRQAGGSWTAASRVCRPPSRRKNPADRVVRRCGAPFRDVLSEGRRVPGKRPRSSAAGWALASRRDSCLAAGREDPRRERGQKPPAGSALCQRPGASGRRHTRPRRSPAPKQGRAVACSPRR